MEIKKNVIAANKAFIANRVEIWFLTWSCYTIFALGEVDLSFNTIQENIVNVPNSLLIVVGFAICWCNGEISSNSTLRLASWCYGGPTPITLALIHAAYNGNSWGLYGCKIPLLI